MSKKTGFSKEAVTGAVLATAGLVPVTMVSLATQLAMAEQPPDAMARMMLLNAFVQDYLLWVALPALVVFVAAVIYSRRHHPELAKQIFIGLAAGAIATIALDVFRIAGVRFGYMPTDMPAMFGKMIAGPRSAAGVTMTTGYLYHFINGASFGLLYILLAGRPRWYWGIAWGLIVELAMMTFPPMMMMGVGYFGLKAGLGVFGTTLVAHLAYGAVLGWLVERWADEGEPVITLLRPIQSSAGAKSESAA